MSVKLGIIIMAVWLSSLQCVRETTIQLPEQPVKIVALSHFTGGQPIQVEVSLSQSLTDAGDPTLPFNADVSIAVKGQFLDKLFRVADDGGRIYWESRDLVQPNVPYELSVRIPGIDPIDAVSAAPFPAKLAGIRMDSAAVRLVDLTGGKKALRIPLEISLNKLPASNRYFAFGLQHEIEVFEWVNGVPVPDEYYQASSKFLADGRTLALIYDTPEKVILINENFWNDNETKVAIDALIPFDPANERPRRLFLEWRTLSEEFYRYHLSLARQGNNLPLNDPDALYNNIQGGYGNFSGYSITLDTLALPDVF